jgi:hypothetical protein
MYFSKNFNECLNHLYFHVDAGGEIQIGQIFDGLGCRFDNVDQSFVDPHFILVACIFINKSGAVNSIFDFFGRQRNRAKNLGIAFLHGIDNGLGGFVDYLVIERLDLDADLLFDFLFRLNRFLRFFFFSFGHFSMRA